MAASSSMTIISSTSPWQQRRSTFFLIKVLECSSLSLDLKPIGNQWRWLKVCVAQQQYQNITDPHGRIDPNYSVSKLGDDLQKTFDLRH